MRGLDPRIQALRFTSGTESIWSIADTVSWGACGEPVAKLPLPVRSDAGAIAFLPPNPQDCDVSL
jgi:hypothetical protein